MNISRKEESDAAVQLQALRLELQACRRELEAVRSSSLLAERLIAVRSDVSLALSKESSLAETLRKCAEAIVRQLDAAFARIWTLNQQDAVLELQASEGLYTRLDGVYSRIPVGDLKVGWIARENKPHLTNAVPADPRIGNKEWARDNGLVSFAGYPLAVEGRVVGVMALFARHSLSEATLNTLAAVADAIAQGIERKRSEAAIQASEHQFRAIVETVPGMICTLKPTGQVELLSRQVLQYFGKTVEELRNWSMTDAVHPDDLPCVIERWRRSIETGEPFDSEQRQRRSDGVYRWHHSRALPSRDDTGAITGWYMLITDIDDRRQAEQALQRSQAYLTEAQQLSRTGSFGWKPTSGELIWSEETFRIMGLDPGTRPTVEMVLDRVHPEDVDLVQKGMDMARRNLTDFELEHRILFPDGSIKHVHVVARVVTDRTGITEYVGAVMDITERQQAKVNLQFALVNLAKSEAEFRTILNAMPTHVWCALSDGSSEFQNQQWLEYTGLTLEQAKGCGWREAIHPDDLNYYVNRWLEIKASGAPGEAEVRFRRYDGVYRRFLMRVVPIRNDHGEIVRWYGTNTDIEDLKQTADALRSSEQFARGQGEALRHILDALAHESSPDRIVEHVMRTITEELCAHSCSVWSKDTSSGLLHFGFSLVSGEFRTNTDARYGASFPSDRLGEIWRGVDLFDSGQPQLVEDIREGPDFPWRSDLLAHGIISVLVVPMLVAGEVRGIVGIRFDRKRLLRPEEIQLAQTLANQAMLAMHLSRISAQSRQAAVLAERNRLARDIHDTLAQGFTGIIIQLEAADDATSQGLAKEAGEHVRRAGVLARESLQEARRSVRALRPQALEHMDLSEALKQMLRKMTEGTALRTKLSIFGTPSLLAADWEEHLLRICQEVLTNTLRHSQAGKFDVGLAFTSDAICLELRDDGRGFQPSANPEGFGLLGIRERVEGMGGAFALDSSPGKGTCISVTLPFITNSQPRPA
jgi:PAS domain S-box-containing protein